MGTGTRTASTTTSPSSSWGRLCGECESPDTLQGISIPVLSEEQCGLTAEDRFCVADQEVSMCFGDSGGPVIAEVEDRWELWGDVSFGYGTDNNCEDWRYNVNGAVHSVLDWIAENAGEECA